MANLKISELPQAGDPQVTDLFPIVQADGLDLVTNKISFGDLKLNIISSTHADLLSAISTGSLIAGIFYRITDFQTIHVIPETSVVNTAATEPLVCLAIANNKLSRFAYSEQYPQDIIEYDSSNVLAEDTITARKGKITYRKDMVRNLETWYDLRTVKFRRWKLDGTGMTTWAATTGYTKGQNIYNSGNFYKAVSAHTSTSDFTQDHTDNKWILMGNFSGKEYSAWSNAMNEFGGSVTANTSDFNDVTTFSSGCKNISIPPANIPYNNVVFIHDVNSYTLGANCTKMTLGGWGYAAYSGHVIGDNSSGIIIFGSKDIKIGHGCSGVIVDAATGSSMEYNCHEIFIQGADYNLLGVGVYTSFLGNGVEHNKIGGGTTGNVIKQGSYYNTIGEDSADNFITDSSSNSIGNSSNNNKISGSTNMRIGNNASNNVCNGSESCSIGDGSNTNSFNNGAANCAVGNSSSNNVCTDGADSCRIGNGSSNNVLTDGAYDCIIGNYSSDNEFDQGSGGIILGDESNENLFHGASYTHLKDDCSRNVFTNCSYNKLSSGCKDNTFTSQTSRNILHEGCTNNEIGFEDYYSTVNNVFMPYCNNIKLSGSNNVFEPNCSFITGVTDMAINQSYFSSGVNNIEFDFVNGAYITGLKIMLPNEGAITLTQSTLNEFNYKTFDMKDSSGDLWANSINDLGIVTTIKLQ